MARHVRVLRPCALIAGVLAFALLVFGVWAFISSCRFERDRRDALTAEPVRMRVDLSTRGEYRGTFQGAFAAAHAEEILLNVAPPFESPENARSATEGLALELKVADTSGRVLRNRTSGKNDYLREARSAGRVLLFSFAPVDREGLGFTLTVVEPAPALQGRSQQLTARYVLCGVEKAGAMMGFAISTGSLLLGVILTAVAWQLFRRSMEGNKAR